MSPGNEYDTPSEDLTPGFLPPGGRPSWPRFRPADNPELAVKFYSEVFGWKFQKWDGPQEYWLVTTGPDGQPGINGGLLRRRPGATTVNAIDVPSVDALAPPIEAKGAKTVLPKMAIPGVGWLAYCTDPDGNIFGIHQADPLPGKNPRSLTVAALFFRGPDMRSCWPMRRIACFPYSAPPPATPRARMPRCPWGRR